MLSLEPDAERAVLSSAASAASDGTAFWKSRRYRSFRRGASQRDGLDVTLTICCARREGAAQRVAADLPLQQTKVFSRPGKASEQETRNPQPATAPRTASREDLPSGADEQRSLVWAWSWDTQQRAMQLLSARKTVSVSGWPLPWAFWRCKEARWSRAEQAWWQRSCWCNPPPATTACLEQTETSKAVSELLTADVRTSRFGPKDERKTCSRQGLSTETLRHRCRARGEICASGKHEKTTEVLSPVRPA